MAQNPILRMRLIEQQTQVRTTVATPVHDTLTSAHRVANEAMTPNSNWLPSLKWTCCRYHNVAILAILEKDCFISKPKILATRDPKFSLMFVSLASLLGMPL